MKKLTRLVALATTLASLVLSGCSSAISDAIVEDTADSLYSERTVTFSVTSKSNLVNFNSYDGSRSILPAAYKCDDLWFWYQYKNVTSGGSWQAAKGIKVDADASDSTGKTGTVILNLTAAQYEFRLYATKRGNEGTQPTTVPTLPDNAVLQGIASADLRTSDTVNFFMTSEGLTRDGTVNLKIYTEGWAATNYSVKAEMQFTKTSGTDLIDHTVGNTDESYPAFPSSIPSEANYTKTAKAGTYNFVVTFTHNTTNKEFVWSDRITILPDGETTETIAIPKVVQDPPEAPATLKATYVDPANDTTAYYTGQFVWEDSSNNEKYFELQVMEVPAGVTTAYQQPTSSTLWNTLKGAAKSASGSNFVFSTSSSAHDSTLDTDKPEDATYKIFYGQTDAGYIGGSVSKNSTACQMYLMLGTRYVARIRAVNDYGYSPWTYATLGAACTVSADPTNNIIAATGYTSNTISRYRVTYQLSGGQFYNPSTPATALNPQPSKYYYYCQEDTADDAAAAVPVYGGNPVMIADKTADFDATKSDKNITLTTPLLKFGDKTWTNWLADYDSTGAALTADPTSGVKAYNAVGAAPANYKGCRNLVLTANYATIGKITIFDDNDYAIGTIESTPAFTITNQKALGLTIAQTNTASNIVWKVNYPTGVKYDQVELKIKSTDGKYEYSVTPVYGADSATFTIPYKTYMDAIYNAQILAYTKVKPLDPYQKTIVLNITQNEAAGGAGGPVYLAATNTVTVTDVSASTKITATLGGTPTPSSITSTLTYTWYWTSAPATIDPTTDTAIGGVTGSEITYAQIATALTSEANGDYYIYCTVTDNNAAPVTVEATASVKYTK